MSAFKFFYCIIRAICINLPSVKSVNVICYLNNALFIDLKLLSSSTQQSGSVA